MPQNHDETKSPRRTSCLLSATWVALLTRTTHAFLFLETTRHSPLRVLRDHDSSSSGIPHPASAFSVTTPHSRRQRRVLASQKDGSSSSSSSEPPQKTKDGGPPLPEVEPGGIDWDGEWKKVVAGDYDDAARPKEIEMDMQRAKRKAARTVEKTRQRAQQFAQKFTIPNNVPRKTSDRSGNRRGSRSFGGGGSFGSTPWILRQDANFYLLALAALSFAPVLLVALTSSPVDQLQPYIV